MADTWIKIREDLPDDPAVIGIARRLGLTVEEVVGCLVRLWAWAGKHTDDGRVLSASHPDIDRITNRTGFGQALEKVRWVSVDDDGVEFPFWDRHNSRCARERALDARRKAEKRKESGQMSGSDPDKTGTRGRGRGREEIDGAGALSKDSEPSGSRVSGRKGKPDLIAEPPIADTPLDTDAFREAWAEWHAYRKERKLSRWTNRTVKMQIKELTDAGHDEAIAAIRRSIGQGWAGLFPDGNRASAGRGGSRPGRNGTTANGNPVGTYDEKIDLTAVTRRYGPPR